MFTLFALATAFDAPTRNYVNGECVEGYDPDRDGFIDFFPSQSDSGLNYQGKVSADYSLLWNVTYHGTYKLLHNKLRDELYVLWQCGTTQPEIPGAHAYFRVPITKAATTSTTYMPYFEMIGERRSLIAYTSTFDFVSSPCLRRLYRDGYINDTHIPDEVELTIADEWSVDSVPYAYSMSDTHEDSVLKVAEYVEVVGLFFNREHEATQAINQIIDGYTCIKDELVSRLDRKQVVLAGYFSSADGFNIASCPNWYCEVVEAAGGQVVEFQGVGAVEMWGWRFMSLEQVVNLTQGADFYMSDAPLPDDGHPTDELKLQVPAVFDNQGPLGYNDWFERRYAEPDAVLADFADILWPDEFDGSRNFMRDITAGEPAGAKVPDDALDAACPNPDAPYQYLLSAATDCLARRDALATPPPTTTPMTGSSSKKKTSTNVGLLVAVIIVFAIAILGLIAFIVYSSAKSKADRHRDFEGDKFHQETPIDEYAKEAELVTKS